jgi:anti-sigma B factor antagonist
MKVSVKESDHASVLVVEGDIDSKTAPEFESGARSLKGGSPNVIIDLTKVGFMSSAGLRVLLMVYRNIKVNDGKVFLVGVSEEIQDIMSSTGFISFFSITEKLDEALLLLKKA